MLSFCCHGAIPGRKSPAFSRLFSLSGIIPTLCRALWSNGFRLDSVIPGILIHCILHIFSPIRRFAIIWVSPMIAIHSGFSWIVSDGSFVLYYTPVSEKINFRFSEGMVVLFFVAISCPISVRLRPNMHVESVGAAFAPMKKYPYTIKSDIIELLKGLHQ